MLTAHKADETQTSQAVEPELIYPAHSLWVLPVVLNKVDVVRGSEETGKC